MKKSLSLILFFLLLVRFSFAQDWEKCGYNQLMEQLKANPEAYKAYIESENAFAQYLKSTENANQRTQEDIILIPVVVHVMHLPSHPVGTSSNISDAQILSQIEVLNEDFAKLFGTRGYNTNPVGADTKIQFCLATKDPQGNPTNGIVRFPYAQSMNSSSNNNGAAMKTLSIWNPDKYLNMWVPGAINGNVLGYATFPGMVTNPSTRNQIDGVVIGARYFGSRQKQPVGQNFNLDNTFAFGRTATHEVGHYLNLIHLWGDGGCNVDDEVQDTPNCSGASFGCPNPRPNSCGSPRMFENYMDYSDDGCMNIFTIGQKDRMRAALNAFSFRRALYQPANLAFVGCISIFPDSLGITAGDNQTGFISTTAANLQTRIYANDSLKTPFEGVAVRFRLVQQPSGANIRLDTTIFSNAQGFASVPFTFDRFTGDYRVEVSAPVRAGTPDTFDLRATRIPTPENKYNIYPVPFVNQATIDYQLATPGNLQIQVINLLGQIIYQYDLGFVEEGYFTLPSAGMINGRYFVRFINEGNVKTIPVLRFE